MATTSAIDAALERFAALHEKDLAQPWRFRDKPTEVRYALYRTIEDAQEGRYAVQTRYAVDRADTDPMRVADGTMPTPAQTNATGSIAEILARVAEARAETDRRLGDLPVAAMTRPTQWIQYDVDVRFRLHRFASHLIEHTVQCEKALAACGWRATEGRRIVRRLTALLGELEGLSADAAREIETRLVERSASSASV
jgi:hypothetical protein